MTKKLSERMSEYAAKFTGDGQEPDLISTWANEVEALEAELALAGAPAIEAADDTSIPPLATSPR